MISAGDVGGNITLGLRTLLVINLSHVLARQSSTVRSLLLRLEKKDARTHRPIIVPTSPQRLRLLERLFTGIGIPEERSV